MLNLSRFRSAVHPVHAKTLCRKEEVPSSSSGRSDLQWCCLNRVTSGLLATERGDKFTLSERALTGELRSSRASSSPIGVIAPGVIRRVIGVETCGYLPRIQELDVAVREQEVRGVRMPRRLAAVRGIAAHSARRHIGA